MRAKRGIIIFAFLSVLMLFAGIFTAAKQDTAESSSSEDFKSKYGEKWKIEKDEETGLPKDIRGFNVDLKKEAKAKSRGISLGEKDTPALVQDFILENKAILGVEPSNLKLNNAEYDEGSGEKEGIWYLSYVQEYNGIPVFGGVFSSVAIEGKLVKISSDYYPNITISAVPGLSAEEVKEIAKKESGIDANPEKVSLIIFPEGGKGVRYRLAQQVDFPLVENPPSRWTYFVDAEDGRILYKYNNVFTASLSGVVTANIYPEYPSKGQSGVNLTNLNVTSINASTTASNFTYNGTYNISINSAMVNITANLSGPYVKVVNADQPFTNHTQNNFNLSGIHSWNFSIDDNSYLDEETNVFYHVNVVHDFFTKGAPFDITAMNYQTIATVQYGSSNCNAFEDSGNVYFYGAGGAGVYCNATSLGADIIYHEYTHAVVEKLYDPWTYWLPYSGQSGGINEGVADYFAATILNRPTIGEGIWSTGPIRFLNNTLRYPASWTEVHDDSRYFSGALWDLRNSTNATFTDELVIKAMKAKARTSSEFLEDFLIFDDNNSDLSDGTPHSALICGAFSANHSIKSGYCNVSLVQYNLNDTITFYAWQDAVSKGQKVNSSESTDATAGMADDDLTIPIDLGFNFTFFGTNYTQVFIGSNGIVLFENASIASFTLWPIPDFTSPNRLIAAYMTDLDPSTSGSGDVYYWRDSANKRFTAEWFNVSVFGTKTNNTFELILTDDGRIIMQYLSLTNGSVLNGSIGIENTGGTAGITYINSSAVVGNRTPLSICFYPNTTNCLIAPNITSFSPSGATASIAEPNSQIFNITVFSFANKNNTNISWYENSSLVQNSIGNNAWTFQGGYNTSGIYNITAVATDGLLTFSQEWLLIVNNTGLPNATIVYPNGNEYLKGIITLNATITDPDGNNTISRVSFYYLNGSSWAFIGNGTNGSGVNYNATWNTSAVSDGDYRISANVTDNSSINSSDVSDSSFTIDNAYPLVNSLSPNGIGNNNWSSSLNITFGFNATDANAGTCVLYLNYSGAYSANASMNYTSNAFSNFSAISFPSDKANIKWNVYCNDSAGNAAWHTGTANYTLNIDSANPAVRLTSPANSTFNRSNFVLFRFNATDDNLDTCRFYLNNSLNGPWNANATIISPSSGIENITNATMADGSYLWNVWCNDSAGNAAFNSTNYTIVIDSILPNILIRTPLNNTKSNAGSLWFNITASETANCSYYIIEYNSSGVQVNATNNTLFNSTGTAHSKLANTYIILQNQSRSITEIAQCNDTAGNNNTNSTTVFIDLNVPGILSQYPNNASSNIPFNANITINFTENISAATLSSVSAILMDSARTSVSVEISYDSSINQTVLNPYVFLLDNTTYFVNLTRLITDGTGNNLTGYLWNFTTAEKDTDGDGNPDWNETDLDNDGVNDAIDYLIGNFSNINTNLPEGNLNISINNSANLSGIFNNTLPIKIFNSTMEIAEFNFTFSNETKLDLTNITLGIDQNGSRGSVLIRGIKLPANLTKTVFINNLTNAAGACIKDAEVTNLGEISSSCKETNETWLPCPGTSGRYSCTVNGTRYMISGTRNSAIIQANDTAAPLITAINTSNSGTTTVTVTLSTTTDENSTCRYAASNLSYSSMSAMATTGSTTHSNQIGYTSDNSGVYYVRCNDSYGNVMQSSNSTSFSADVAGSASASGSSGGGGGSSGTAAETKESFSGFDIPTSSTITKRIASTSIGIASIAITAKNAVTNSDLTVEKLPAKPQTTPDLTGKVYQYLKITATINDSDIALIKIGLKVEKSWLAASGVNENDIVLFRLTDKWNELKTSKLNSDENYTNYEAESPGFSYYAIAQKERILKNENKTETIKANITIEPSLPVAQDITKKEFEEKKKGAAKEKGRSFAAIKGLLLILVGILAGILAVLFVAHLFSIERGRQ